nr:hypothetical protein [Shewanella putrefaciens]
MSNLSIPTTSPDDYYQQRIDLQPAFNSDLFQQLLEPENLHRAWRQVKANKGAAGIDGMTIEASRSGCNKAAGNSVKLNLS